MHPEVHHAAAHPAALPRGSGEVTCSPSVKAELLAQTHRFTAGQLAQLRPPPALGAIGCWPRSSAIASLSQTALSQAALSHAALSHAALSHAALSHAALSHAALSRAALSHAALSRAALSRAALSQAALSQAALSHAACPTRPCLGVTVPARSLRIEAIYAR
jgi:hypothetical protein